MLPFTGPFSIGYVDLTNIRLATEDDRRYNVDKWAKLEKDIAEKEAAISDMTSLIAEKDAEIAGKDAEIMRLRAKLGI